MQSIFQLRSMHLQGDGLYTALLIKVFAYLLALRLKAQGVFSKLTLTEIMRQLRREADLRDFLATHFHAPFVNRLRNSGDIEHRGIISKCNELQIKGIVKPGRECWMQGLGAFDGYSTVDCIRGRDLYGLCPSLLRLTHR